MFVLSRMPCFTKQCHVLELNIHIADFVPGTTTKGGQVSIFRPKWQAVCCYQGHKHVMLKYGAGNWL